MTEEKRDDLDVDVEAHKKMKATDDPEGTEMPDVEGHFKSGRKGRLASEESESDDFEGHIKGGNKRM